MEGAVFVSRSVHGVLDHVTRGVDASFVQLSRVERKREREREREGEDETQKG